MFFSTFIAAVGGTVGSYHTTLANAATYLGDPELFWWVADASRAMNPDDLTAPPDAGGPPRTVLVPQIGG